MERVLVLLSTFWLLTHSCSNILVTPGASADGTTLLGDNDDSASRHGLLTHFDAADHPVGSLRTIYDFETGRELGQIPQPAHTFSTVSHANEKGVVIAETTQGGLSSLDQSGKDHRNGTIMDYGSLIVSTLQRVSTAREAIQTMVDLCNTYGYASSMEGFSITDGTESWYMELIGKGNWSNGVIWVALRVPDGYVTANANQARITTFLPCDDPDHCLAAPDVVTFAIEHKLYTGSPDDLTFSFSDTYDPVTPTGARFCEARVWFMFSQIADPADFDSAYYLPYAQGFNLTRRMPLWVRPKQKVTRAMVHSLLSATYQGTWLDTSKDVGAGPEGQTNRWNGLTWEYNKKTYVNERIIGTQFTAWHFVASVRDSSVAAPMRALLWWGTDDHGIAPKIPLFGSVTQVHKTYDDGNCSARLACRKQLGLPGSMMQFSWDSAYWVNSAVAKLAYSERTRAMPVVHQARACFEQLIAPKLNATEYIAAAQFARGDEQAGLQTLNDLAVFASKEATAAWTKLWQKLMISFVDGMTTTEDASSLICGCKKAAPVYSDEWASKVVADTADHYVLPNKDCAWIDPDGHCHHKKELNEMAVPKSKLEVPGVLH